MCSKENRLSPFKVIDVELTDSIFAEAERLKLKPYNEEECKKTLPMLRCQLKALIARDIWDMNEYFRIMNEANHIVCRAVEIATK